MTERAYRVEDVRYLNLGKQGENLARNIRFDVASFAVSGGSLELMIKRPGDTQFYKVQNLYMEDSKTAFFSPDAFFTQFPGKGLAIMVSAKNGRVVKTAQFEVEVEKSACIDTPDVPTPPTPHGSGWTTDQVSLLGQFNEYFAEMARNVVYKDEEGVPGYAAAVNAAAALRALVASLLGSVNAYIASLGTITFTSVSAESCTFDSEAASVTIHM